jgi:predicted O-methyltransferase YrrM
MIRIRPHHLFNLVNTPSYEARMVKIVLPDQRAPILLDTAVLLALAKLVQPRAYFEFGTYLGVQLLNIIANLPPSARAYTLDLDEESAGKARQHANDRPLTLEHLQSQHRLAFAHSSYESQVTRLYGDSNTFDFSRFDRCLDMIFVDGGHDPRTLRSDTENSFRMLSEDHVGCIAWHDYGNPIYPQLKKYLDGLPEMRDFFFVEESMVAFCLKNGEHLAAALKNNV